MKGKDSDLSFDMLSNATRFLSITSEVSFELRIFCLSGSEFKVMTGRNRVWLSNLMCFMPWHGETFNPASLSCEAVGIQPLSLSKKSWGEIPNSSSEVRRYFISFAGRAANLNWSLDTIAKSLLKRLQSGVGIWSISHYRKMKRMLEWHPLENYFWLKTNLILKIFYQT